MNTRATLNFKNPNGAKHLSHLHDECVVWKSRYIDCLLDKGIRY